MKTLLLHSKNRVESRKGRQVPQYHRNCCKLADMLDDRATTVFLFGHGPEDDG